MPRTGTLPFTLGRYSRLVNRGVGTMKRALLATLGLVFGAVMPAHAQLGTGNVIRCESDNGRTHECAVGYVRDARLLRQLSRGACVEGESWGVTHRSIWVAHGCRGEFLIDDRGRDDDRGGIGSGDHIRCESDDGRWKRCDVRARGRVEIVRQLSRSACVRGQSWGTDAQGIWVSGGCRAEFRVERRAGHDEPSLSRFTCESSNGSPRFCAAGSRGDVRLVRQISRSPCVEGRTWGRERNGVWVGQGCRAEFEVSGRGRRYD